jgi:hypothetical protein
VLSQATRRKRVAALIQRFPGITGRALARRLGVSLPTIRRDLEAMGTSLSKLRAPLNPLHDRREVERLVAELGEAGAARHFGVSRQAVNQRMAKWASE